MKQFFKILFYFLIISICIGQRPYYKGEWKKNRYHGNGELLDKFGIKYVGEFFEGIKHGRGVLKYSNGARFEGQFIDGKKTEGTYYYSNGTKYIGKWKRGKKHGNGILESQINPVLRGMTRVIKVVKVEGYDFEMDQRMLDSKKLY